MASKKQRKRRKRRPPPPPAAQPEQLGPAAEAEPAPVASVRAKRREDERPQPLWGSFPLSEIVILVGLAMFVIGFVFMQEEPRNRIVGGIGLLLGALAGGEVAVREHFAGYRSHTSLLAGAAGVGSVAAVLAIGRQDIPLWVGVAIGFAVGGTAAYFLLRAFRRASGGASIKLR
jgi:hypothetical protein